MNHSQVAHIWAQNNGENKSGCNMFCRGTAIFSYGEHFMLARHLQIGGVWVVFHNNNGHSVSTAKHQCHVRGATSHLEGFWVDDPAAEPASQMDYFAQQLQDVLDLYAETTSRHVAKRPELIDRARQAVADFNRLRELTGSRRKPLAMPGDFGAEAARIKERREKRRKREAAARKRTEARRARRIASQIAAWRAGERLESLYAGSEDLLRIRGDEIETSQGAVIPLAHGLRAFDRLAELRETIPEEGSRDLDIKVGHFTIDRLTREYVTAGCHEIKWAEILRCRAAVAEAEAAAVA